MSRFIDAERGLAHRARLGTHLARRTLVGDAALGVKFEHSHPVAFPTIRRHRECGRGTRCGTGHGGAGDTGLRRRLEVRRPGGETSVGWDGDDRMGWARLDAGTAASTGGEKSHFGKSARRPEVSPMDDPFFGLGYESLEPVAHCRAQQLATSRIGRRQHGEIWRGSGDPGKRASPAHSKLKTQRNPNFSFPGSRSCASWGRLTYKGKSKRVLNRVSPIRCSARIPRPASARKWIRSPGTR
jgi:hypothetical protein